MKRTDKTLHGLYSAAWRVAVPLLRFSKRLAAGYKERQVPATWLPEPVDVWIQAASAGEARLAAEIVRHLPAWPSILLTAMTDQGLDELKRAQAWSAANRPELTIHCAYFPFDAPNIMQKALEQARPKLIVLLETELWPGLMTRAAELSIPVMIANARMRPESLRRYLPFANFFQSVKPVEVLATTTEDAARFAVLFSLPEVRLMRNIKLDRLARELESKKNSARSAKLSVLFPGDAPLVVLGSTRRQEEADMEIILQALLARRGDIIIALCPRHLHRVPHWTARLDKMGCRWRLRSKLSAEKPAQAGNIVLWDVFGELTQAYGLAEAIFVGGSLRPLGGQNFLEALGAGVVPCIGPSWYNFAWVGQEIITAGLVKVGQNAAQIADLLLEQLRHRPAKREIQDRLAAYLAARRGGAALVCARMMTYLPEKIPSTAPKRLSWLKR